ncbi:MAG: N-acetylneuraminate synthase family protein, partial [Planctomycetales bacterium]
MPPTSLALGSRAIGPNAPALVVAEIGQNHNGRKELAEELIDAAAWAGADAVKVTKRDLSWDLCAEASARPYRARHAFGPTYGEHRAVLELSPEDHRDLAERIRGHGMAHVGTACDPPSAALLHELKVDALKIASRDLDNLPLIECVAKLGRLVIASTGMSGFEEIDATVHALRAADAKFVLLQCASLYPTPWKDVHLRSMGKLAERYDAAVGLSD